MGTDTKLVALYRVAPKGNKNAKNKPDYVTNENCLNNFKTAWAQLEMYTDWSSQLEVFADGFGDTPEWLGKHHELEYRDNSKSFMHVLQFAIDNYNDDDIVYFVEDDYIHVTNRVLQKYLMEGLQLADYVSLYDHPDKYPGRPLGIKLGDLRYWKYEVSTTMTFAARVKTLREDFEVFNSMITTGNPPDHYIFIELNKVGRRLATPMPGLATHGEIEWLAPFQDWRAYV